MLKIFGFSTGNFQDLPLNTIERLKVLADAGCTAVELSFKRLEPNDFKKLTPGHFSPFQYVSLHAPKNSYKKGDPAVAEIFERINQINKIRKLDLVVIHPDPIEDFSVFDNVDFPIGLENMDEEKNWSRRPEEMESAMSKNPKFKMVLDVNHVFMIDPTMKLAGEFYDKFGDRIVEIHLSGAINKHQPLFETKQEQIIRSIRDFDIPIIVESFPLTPETMITERDYIVKVVEKI